MEKTMIPLTEVYKIADKMARPWHWAAGVLAETVAGLLVYLIMAKTVAIAEISAEDLQSAMFKSTTNLVEE